MIGVRCSRCHAIHEKGQRCPNCIKLYNDKRDKSRSRFYQRKEWHLMRQKVIDYYCNVDIWMLGLTGKLIPCTRPVVHHIQTFEKHPEKALTFSNLVCLSSSSHNTVHEYYDTGRYSRAVKILRDGMAKYEEIKNGQSRNGGDAFTE